MTQQISVNEWALDVHERIRSALREAREAAGMSAQQVADRTGGVLSRSAIANYESGRKTALDVTEVLALSAALQIPPITLLFSGHPDELVEVLPGDTRSTTEAIGWYCGDPLLAKDAVAQPESQSYRLLELVRNRAQMHRTLAATRQALADASEWALRHRDANMKAADELLSQIAEIEAEMANIGAGEQE